MAVSEFVALTSKYVPNNEKPLLYGTAGFRSNAKYLNFIVFRMGLVAVLRSKSCSGQAIGLMLTASHNPEEDNGVKIIDPLGEMLESSWESSLDKLVNTPNDPKLLSQVIEEIIEKHKVPMSQKSLVVLGRDTRPSGQELLTAAIDGIVSSGGEYVDHGFLSTPQLHYIVRCLNTNQQYGIATEKGYYEKLSKAYLELVENKIQKSELLIDGSNGIGASKLLEMGKYIGDKLTFQIINDGSQGKLNDKCGADFVKVNQKLPSGVEPKINCRFASVDGDADRLVYYFLNEEGKFTILDGDKIATLIATYIKELLEQSGLELSMGVVQTAYANGSSTSYIQDTLGATVKFANTGVKYLHPIAETFDIGIYFEANGHGTVLFSHQAIELILSQADSKPALTKLKCLTELINQAVGDAISDLLVVEAILLNKNFTVQQWNSFYTDLPNRLMKVQVQDRGIFETTDAERTLIRPEGLQSIINDIVKKYNKSRSFVRPSGTEDVVRIYAEAETKEQADQLAFEVCCAVYDNAQGVGEKPTLPK